MENDARTSFVFYQSWWEAIRNLPRDVQGDVLTAIIEYGLYGETTEQLKPIAKAMLAMAKSQIDTNRKRYENGKKGGRKKLDKNQAETKSEPNRNQTETKSEPIILNVNDNVNDNVLKENTAKAVQKKAFDLSFVDPSYQGVFSDWLAYKKARKESYKTQKSVEACYAKLVKLSGGDFIRAGEIVSQSMANNWAGLFELKQENGYGKRSDTQARRESVSRLKELSASVLGQLAGNEG